MQEHNPTVGQQRFIAPAVRIIEYLKIIIVLGFIIQVTLNCFRTVSAFDFPWQLAEGQFILNHGYAPKSVLQAYGDISPRFANEYIPYEIVIAGINHVSGWIGLCLFFGIITLLIYAPCLMAFFKSKGRYPLMAAFLFMIALEINDWRLSARPEIIADACYMTVGMSLLHHKGFYWNGFQLFSMGLIFCIWSNAHGTFLVGLMMVGLWYSQIFLFNWKLIALTKDIKWIELGMAALIGSMINPDGFYRFIQPFALHGLLWGQATSYEMWPVPLGEAWIPITGTVVGIIVLARRIQKQITYWIIALLLILQYLSFTSNRFSIFIGLTLLIIVWNEVTHGQNIYQPKRFPLFFALGKASGYLLLTLFYAEFLILLITAMKINVGKQTRFMYPNTLITINSSFAWLRLQSKPNYMLLSLISEGSMAQMPGHKGIHPMLDSGTHRYSDENNKLYYYILNDPATFGLILSRLKANALILDDHTFCWAAVANANPEWKLVQIGTDSQLYLREANPDVTAQKKMFLQWEQNEKHDSSDPVTVTTENMLRGLNLRSDDESLRMLESTQDMVWTFDPQITYLENWLGRVPDGLVRDALSRVDGKMDNSSMAIRILFALRLQQYDVAMGIARKWEPFILDKGYQECQELRAEAFISGKNDEAARKILESLWPQPRYSLRWAKLCQQAYTGRTVGEPDDARLLTDLEKTSAWKDDVITKLNQNIISLSTQQR